MKKAVLIMSIMLLLFIACKKSEEPEVKKQEEYKQEIKQNQQFSQLEITDIKYENGKVSITGISDLPNGSGLTVSLDVANRPGSAPSISKSTKAIVENGKFSAMITPPEHPEFAKGPHIIRALFTPRSEPDYILNLVGKDGENLIGDKVGRRHVFKYLKTEKQIDLKIKGVSYPIINIDSYPVVSPERALLEFLSSWQKKDWNRMPEFVQKTWNNTQKNPAEMLEAWFGFKQLLGAKIINKNTISDVMVDITATIYYAIGSDISKKSITARIIRESAPFTPSSSGDWGINPTSILKEK